MHAPYHLYGQSPGAIAGAATAAASAGTTAHLDSKGFFGVNWKSLVVAVAIGSLTAVLTQLTLEYVRERRQSGAKPKHKVLLMTDKP